jgi:LmbE family N-acetylglucosaminyl deacetylase
MKRRLRLILLILMLFALISYRYDLSRSTNRGNPENFPRLELSGVHRLLVIAPHPDDETIGAGGLIQIALTQKIDVKVMIVTNGDAQRFAPTAYTRRLRTRPGDYINWGDNRQVETLHAAQVLGLKDSQVDFLSYPDRGLMPLWIQDWNTNCPLRSSYTRLTYPPYPLTFDPAASYCGRDVLANLGRILEDYHPDLVVLPHPDDDHPDHKATSSFTLMALALLEQKDPGYHPQILGYLVHFGYYPQPRSLHTSATLRPPLPLMGSDLDWLNLDLSPGQTSTKLAALRKHATQMRLLGNFLPSFARKNELFAQLHILDLSLLEINGLSLQESQGYEQAVQGYTRESTRRLLVPGADLTGWKIARFGDSLVLSAETRGRPFSEFRYRILVKTPDGQTHPYPVDGSEMTHSPNPLTAILDLAELGDPTMLGFSADVSRGRTFDQTGWTFAILRNPLRDLLSNQDGPY